jgi:hypothetical protein
VRVFGLSVVAVTLALVGVHRVSFDPLRESFRQGATAQWDGFDAERWSRLFERHPTLRKVYLADRWRDDSWRSPTRDAAPQAPEGSRAARRSRAKSPS